MKKQARERLSWLERTLAGGGTIHLSEAARQCGVSKMTIRRDVEASQGTLSLFAGRLLSTDNPRYAPVYDLDVESDTHLAAKQRLCREAARRVATGDTLFVDCGTTLIHLAGALDPDISLTVVTYALNVANVFSRLAHVRLMLLGGLYHPSSQSFSGDDAGRVLRHIGINKAFISAAGVHAERGVSCFHFHEVAPKQAALDVAEHRILVADESKHARIRPALFARWADFDAFITNGAPSARSRGAAGQSAPGPRIIRV